MEFFKKTTVLKQTENGYAIDGKALSGIARIEIESGVADFYLTIINALPLQTAVFKAGLLNGKSLTVFDLGKHPASFHHLLENFNQKEDFAVGLFVESDDIPITIAFAKEPCSKLSLTDFKKAVAEKCLAERKTKLKPCPPPIETPSTQEQPTCPLYDDEAVATLNYYELDQEVINITENIDIKEQDYVRNEDELSFIDCQEKTQQVKGFSDRISNETDADFSTELKEEQPYYRTVEKELTNIFEKFPAETCLQNLFPDSKFAKINYSSDKYYVVGLIKENGKERYICYGVPATYSKEPPKELAGYCTFIPLSVFCLNGDGFWMMFQDAESGKCVNCATV